MATNASCMKLADDKVMLFVATDDGHSIAFPMANDDAETLYSTLGVILGKDKVDEISKAL